MMLRLKKVENVIQNVFNEDQDPMKWNEQSIKNKGYNNM